MGYRKEFPDFNPATMPPIPSEWTDVSWHNDTCPSFEPCIGVQVYVDYADPAQREVDTGFRFIVMDVNRAETLLQANIWDEIVAFIPQAEEIAQDACEHKDTGRGVCAHCGKIL